MDLVELIKVKLTERSLSPRQLSLEAGLSPGYVSKVLGGMSPSLGAFAALVEVLDCSQFEVLAMVRAAKFDRSKG